MCRRREGSGDPPVLVPTSPVAWPGEWVAARGMAVAVPWVDHLWFPGWRTWLRRTWPGVRCHVSVVWTISLPHLVLGFLEWSCSGLSSPTWAEDGVHACLYPLFHLPPWVGRKGSGPGPCRKLQEQGVLSPGGVLAPPWAGVTCELPVGEALPTRGQQR